MMTRTSQLCLVSFQFRGTFTRPTTVDEDDEVDMLLLLLDGGWVGSRIDESLTDWMRRSAIPWAKVSSGCWTEGADLHVRGKVRGRGTGCWIVDKLIQSSTCCIDCWRSLTWRSSISWDWRNLANSSSADSVDRLDRGLAVSPLLTDGGGNSLALLVTANWRDMRCSTCSSARLSRMWFFKRTTAGSKLRVW